jgi:REP element-mobilizing transposase RayT
MTSNEKFGRKYTRLKNYNYAANGYYFVTICTNEKQCFFGDITIAILVITQKFLKNISKA